MMFTEDDVYDSLGQVQETSIRSLESAVSKRLPESYKGLIQRYNWLRPKKEFFDIGDNPKGMIRRDISFYGFDVEQYPGSGTILEVQSGIDYFPIGLVIIGYCANGDYICLDYRNNSADSNPPVCLVFHDDYHTNEDGSSEMRTIQIADSFDGLVEKLKP